MKETRSTLASFSNHYNLNKEAEREKVTTKKRKKEKKIVLSNI
jgi:hypothetical protein